MRITISLILLFNGLFLFSQEGYKFNDRLSLTIAPLSMLDANSRLRLGIESNISEKQAFNLDIGFAVPFIESNYSIETINSTYKFLEIRPQFKRIIFSGHDTRIYAGLELFASFCKREFLNNYYYPENSRSSVYYEFAKVKREKHGAHLLLGWQGYMYNLFLIDMYVGFGVAYKKIDYYDLYGSYPSQYEIFEEWFPDPYLYEGATLQPNFALGMKIGIIQGKIINR